MSDSQQKEIQRARMLVLVGAGLSFLFSVSLWFYAAMVDYVIFIFGLCVTVIVGSGLATLIISNNRKP